MKDGEYRQAIYNWRELSPHQYEVMAELTRAAFSEYAKDNINFRGLDVTGEILRERMAETDQAAFALEDNGVIIAFCCGYLKGKAPAIQLRREGVQVHPGYRRRGLGGKVIQLMEQWAAENGAQFSELTTSLKATPAIKFHKANGYVPFGYTYYDGKNYQSIVMRKYFGEPCPNHIRWRHMLKTWLQVNMVRDRNGRKRIWIRLKEKVFG